MPMDGYTLSFLSQESNQLLEGSRVDKIYQMDKYSILLNLRKSGSNHRLFISSHPQMGRFCLTTLKYENPTTPPMFCMVLRKYLEGSRLSEIRQVKMERIIHFIFETTNELGDKVTKVLIGEFMGKHSNILLIDQQEEMIHDSIHRFALSENSYREIIPGKKYYEPPAQNKILMEDITSEIIEENFLGKFMDMSAEKAILSLVSGISPAAAKEICLRSSIENDSLVDFLGNIDYQRLEQTIKEFDTYRKNNNPAPYMIKDGLKFLDFTPLKYEIYDHLENIEYTSMNKLVEDFVGGKDRFNKVQQKKDHLKKVLDKELLRLEKRYDINKTKQTDLEKAEELRIYGDLLTANLYQIKQGKEAIVTNYYSEDQGEVTITLDEQLTPNQNAQRYYKKYNKAKSGAENAKEQLKIISEEMSYLDSIIISILNTESLQDLEEIQIEMVESGYLGKEINEKKGNKKANKKEKECKLDKEELDGFEIFVGHNNKQNDYLTMKFASSSDLWFHVKDIPGSHVLVKNPNRQEIPENIILRAATLAAENSKAKNATIVTVDYTIKKHVKKPKGSKPGFVIYDNANTIQVKIN